MKQIFLLGMLLAPLCAVPQLSESFSGPEVTSNNPWEGDVDKFRIHASGQLYFVSPAGETGSASLGVPVSSEKNMTWEMKVKLDFKSSNANNLRIYVMHGSDSIYIQVGNNGRQISLYEKEGDSPKLRISGRKSLLDEPYSFVSIRLTFEEGNLWTLYTRQTGEAGFYCEGSYKMKSPPDNPQALMIFTCRYIKGRISEYYIDDLKVTNTITAPPDPEPDPEPEEAAELNLLLIEVLNESELQLFFDRLIDISEAICEIGNLGEVPISYGQNQSIVKIHIPEPLEDGCEYTLTLEGVFDLKGRWIAGQTWVIEYEEEEETPSVQPAEPGQVIISEVMADPKGSEAFPETEYVELCNVSEATIPLKDWTFVYDGKGIRMEGPSLPPGGYAVLYRAGRAIHVESPAQAVPMEKFPAALANSGKLLQLEDAGGLLIDEFFYPKAQPGIAWERSGDDAYLSTDTRGGTPGSPNSTPGESGQPEIPLSDVVPGEIVFNELLPDPFSGGSEYIELYNRSGRELSLSGLSLAVRDTDGTLRTSYPLSGVSSVVNREGYVLLTKDKEAVAAFYLLSSPEVVYELKLPVLVNTSSTLVLFRMHDGVPIDEVTYFSEWHNVFLKNHKGVALERINPDGRTQDADNWTSAAGTAGYGTPGYLNSQFLKEGTGDITGISPPVLMEDGLYRIAYHLGSSGYRCRINIYDLTGRQVAEIADHELPGTSGEFLWDGTSAAGDRLKYGIYILFAELYKADGRKKYNKMVFLVR
ncbi:MAG: lamin tail domain-containing protein [Tannerellaceae bacterium]|jgi:hypothetical protein|nr:lamin tail domain-containing protein [Tannerellaceae bacterium]